MWTIHVLLCYAGRWGMEGRRGEPTIGTPSLFPTCVQAAKTTKAWLITSGFNMGVMKAVGQAVREGQAFLWDNDRMTHLLRCIAIAPWGYVYNRRYLEGRNQRVSYNSKQTKDAYNVLCLCMESKLLPCFLYFFVCKYILCLLLHFCFLCRAHLVPAAVVSTTTVFLYTEYI